MRSVSSQTATATLIYAVSPQLKLEIDRRHERNDYSVGEDVSPKLQWRRRRLAAQQPDEPLGYGREPVRNRLQRVVRSPDAAEQFRPRAMSATSRQRRRPHSWCRRSSISDDLRFARIDHGSGRALKPGARWQCCQRQRGSADRLPDHGFHRSQRLVRLCDQRGPAIRWRVSCQPIGAFRPFSRSRAGVERRSVRLLEDRYQASSISLQHRLSALSSLTVSYSYSDAKGEGTTTRMCADAH